LAKNIAAQVEALVAPVVDSLGYVLWDVVYAKEGADWHLTVTIDKQEGITLDDCERVHRAIDPVIDQADPIESSYYLHVSSPGIERELRTAAHLRFALGQRVEARLFKAVEGAKTYRGTLMSADDASLVLQTEKGDLVLPREAVSKMKISVFE